MLAIVKKAWLLTLVVILFSCCTLAEVNVDLSELSFEELIDLREAINLALWNTEEWQEVIVPKGVYEIGVDIPAGTWSITAYDGQMIIVTLGNSYDNDKRQMSDYVEMESVYSPNAKTYDEGTDITRIDLELHEGQYLDIKMASAVFTPFIGKQDLGFK